MAAEATVTVTLSFSKGNIPTQTFASGPVSVNVSGNSYLRNVQNVGTSKEALLAGDVGTLGLVAFHNCDPANFVQVFPNATDAACLKIKPLEWQLFRFDPAATPNLKADTAAVNLEFLLLPD
jgi:hypothetical protein